MIFIAVELREEKDKYHITVQPHLKRISELRSQGYNEKEVANELNISISTLKKYKKRYHKLKQALSMQKSIYYMTIKPNMDKIQNWVKNGATEKEVANNLGISHSTLVKYKNKFTELSEALRVNRELFIDEVEKAYNSRAIWNEVETIKVITTGDDEVVKKEVTTTKLPPDRKVQERLLAKHNRLYNADEQEEISNEREMKKLAKEKLQQEVDNLSKLKELGDALGL